MRNQYTLVDFRSRARLRSRILTQSCIGCYLSHREIMQDIVANGPDMVAVFENDISISLGLQQVLTNIEHTDHEFDIIFLHWNRTDKAFIPVCRLCNHYRLGIVKFSDWGAQGYVITKKAALDFLKYFPKVVHHADHALCVYWEYSG